MLSARIHTHEHHIPHTPHIHTTLHVRAFHCTQTYAAMRSPTAVATSLSVTDDWFGQSSVTTTTTTTPTPTPAVSRVTPTTTPAVSRVQSDTLPGDITFPQPLAVSYQIVCLSLLFVCLLVFVVVVVRCSKLVPCVCLSVGIQGGVN